MIGGWANQRIIIRRKQGDNVIRDVQQFDILDKDRPIVFLIQVLQRKAAAFTLHSLTLFMLSTAFQAATSKSSARTACTRSN